MTTGVGASKSLGVQKFCPIFSKPAQKVVEQLLPTVFVV